MEDKIINKFISKIKDKLSKNKTTYPSVNEYAFSTEEIKNISEQNKQKIQELKQDTFSKKKKTKLEQETISPIKDKTTIEAGLDETTTEEQQSEHQKEEILEKEQIVSQDYTEETKIEFNKTIEEILETEEQPKNSFVNLSEEYQKIVMTKWNEIDYKLLDKDIMNGKDLLNRNYTITYADDSAKFIHGIRKRYEIVICYLIGFNNEKKGLYEKTIFSDKIENEWKYLSNYIKVLEKIRSFRK